MDSSAQAEVNKLTLELMLPRSKYKRYLAKQDPDMLEQMEAKCRNFAKYRARILSLAVQLIDGIASEEDGGGQSPLVDATPELKELMERFVERSVSHFTALKQSENFSDEDSVSEPMMFDPNQMSETSTSNGSFWGKRVTKLDGTLNGFVTRK